MALKEGEWAASPWGKEPQYPLHRRWHTGSKASLDAGALPLARIKLVLPKCIAWSEESHVPEVTAMESTVSNGYIIQYEHLSVSYTSISSPETRVRDAHG
jgi:hypothetical protein